MVVHPGAFLCHAPFVIKAVASKSDVVSRLDHIQDSLAALVKPLGFRRRGRTFVRVTDADLRQIIALQAGPYEIGAPLPAGFAHMRPNLYGMFTVNLGVYVPEMHDRSNPPLKPSRIVTDAHCNIRVRLGWLSEGEDTWWPLAADPAEVIDEVAAHLLGIGIPWLERFGTRDDILRDWVAFNEEERRLSWVARLDTAMILLRRGDVPGATALFQAHLDVRGKGPINPGHEPYVRDLAARLGLGPLS